MHSHESFQLDPPSSANHPSSAILRVWRALKPKRLLAFAALGGVILFGSLLATPNHKAQACGAPAPPVCNRTTALAKAVRRVFVVRPGLPTPVSVPFTVFVGSNGPCPNPVCTTVTMSAICNLPPNAPPASTICFPTPLPGVYVGKLVLVFPPGPPRVCTVSGIATTSWNGGLPATSGRGDVQVCLVEPSPTNPNIPRLDLELLSDDVASAHPGDQRQHVIRVTNNDPVNSVTGMFGATSVQTGRLSTYTPAPPPGSGDAPGSAASPFTGDAFPMADDEVLPPTPGACNYALDDGTADDGIGLVPPGDIIWLNQFTVMPGREIIDKICVGFGAAVNGKPFTVGLWRDLNNDGNPSDAFLLTRADGIAANAGTNTLNNISIPPTVPGPVGSSFFVGVLMRNTAFPPELPAAIDQSPSQSRSWVAVGDVCGGDIQNLSNNASPPALIDSYGFPGNWLVRAEGVPIDPPSPWVQLGDPGLANQTTVAKPISLCPGESRVVRINQRSYRMCKSGSCNEASMQFSGTYTNGETAFGCVQAGFMVDSVGQGADFRCPDGGVMTQVDTPSPTRVNFHGQMPTHTVDQSFQVLGTQIIPVGSKPLTPRPPQSSILDPQFGRNSGRLSVTHDAQIPLQVEQAMQVSMQIQIAPKSPTQQSTIVDAGVHPGDTNLGDSYFFINVSSRLTGPGIPPTLDSFFDVFTTVSLDGITSGLHRPSRILPSSISAVITGPHTLSVTFVAMFPSNPQLPPIVPQVNLNVDGVGSAFGLRQPPACPSVTNGPYDVLIVPDQDRAIFSVAVAGSNPISYQWFHGVTPLSNNGHIQGAQTATLIINNPGPADAGVYSCVAVNACGSVTSGPATLGFDKQVPCCDFNNDNVINSQDFFDFLVAFFGSLPSSDFNGDGILNSQDFFDFIVCFFTPPAGCP